MFQICEEDLPVGGRFDSHGRDHASCADGAQDGEYLPSAVGRRFMNASASGATRIKPRHLRRDTAFIQINQAFRRGGADRFKELRAPLSVGFGIALLGVE